MPSNLHGASVGVFVQYLTSLAAILKKAEASAAARKIDPQVFVMARIAPDMFPLLRQVQIATDTLARGASVRLSARPASARRAG